MIALALLAVLAVPIGQATPTPSVSMGISAEQPDPYASLPHVDIETSAGRIVLALETQKAPITAKNFLAYVEQKRLDGVVFYRTVKVADYFGFVQFGVDGDPKRTLPPIKHEPTTLTGLHHVDGTISVARFDPGSARGEFTISVGDQTNSLDAHPERPGDNLGFAAFGHVEGMDVVVKILNAPVSPTATLRGSFKGEVPEAPIKVISARRL